MWTGVNTSHFENVRDTSDTYLGSMSFNMSVWTPLNGRVHYCWDITLKPLNKIKNEITMYMLL